MDQHITRIEQIARDLRQQLGSTPSQSYQATNLTQKQQTALELVHSTALIAGQVNLPKQIVINAFESGWTQGLREQQPQTQLFAQPEQYANR